MRERSASISIFSGEKKPAPADNEGPPLKSESPISRFILKESEIPLSSHVTYTLEKTSKKTGAPKEYIAKEYSKDRNGELMALLEATNSSFYNFLIPRHSAVTRTDKESKYRCLSKTIPHFASLKKKTLPEEALDTSYLDHFSIATIEIIDKTYRHIEVEERENLSTDKKYAFTGKDLAHYRMIAGLAVGMMASLINKEADLHRGNINREGIRLDYDMSWWEFLFEHKYASLYEVIVHRPLRSAAADTFKLTARDIHQFPDLQDATPGYWPTVPVLSPLENAYTADENVRFKKLQTHPVMIYYKYATLLKYILTAPQFSALSHHHLGSEKDDRGRSLGDLFAEAHRARAEEAQIILEDMPEFHHFLFTHGHLVFEAILEEIKLYNAIQKEGKPTVDLKNVRHRFHQLIMNMTRKKIDSALTDFQLSDSEKESNLIFVLKHLLIDTRVFPDPALLAPPAVISKAHKHHIETLSSFIKSPTISPILQKIVLSCRGFQTAFPGKNRVLPIIKQLLAAYPLLGAEIQKINLTHENLNKELTRKTNSSMKMAKYRPKT